MIPNEKKIREKLLVELYASQNHAAIPKDLYKQVADYFPDELELSDLERYRESKSKWAMNVQWIRQHLIAENIILTPDEHKRNEWKLSEKGIKIGRELFIQNFGYDEWQKKIEGNNITKEDIEEFTTEEDEVFPEGKLKFELHLKKERNKKLIVLKKKLAFNKNPLLPCEICGISFKEKYGDIGKGFIEAHHIFPISQLTEETITKLEDLILVCSNCHKIIHRRRPWLTVKELSGLLTS